MALDVVTLFVGGIALFLMAIIFFGLLRMSNKLFSRRLFLIEEQQKNQEKLTGKFIDMTVENRKEIINLKKELEKENKPQDLEKENKSEIKTEESVAVVAAEKARTRYNKKQ